MTLTLPAGYIKWRGIDRAGESHSGIIKADPTDFAVQLYSLGFRQADIQDCTGRVVSGVSSRWWSQA
jgi:hypothetical protein